MTYSLIIPKLYSRENKVRIIILKAINVSLIKCVLSLFVIQFV